MDDEHRIILDDISGVHTYSGVPSFLSSFSSFSALVFGPVVWTAWEVTSGPLFCSEVMMFGELLGLLGLLLPLLVLALELLSLVDSLLPGSITVIFSLIESLGWLSTPSLDLLN